MKKKTIALMVASFVVIAVCGFVFYLIDASMMQNYEAYKRGYYHSPYFELRAQLISVFPYILIICFVVILSVAIAMKLKQKIETKKNGNT